MLGTKPIETKRSPPKPKRSPNEAQNGHFFVPSCACSPGPCSLPSLSPHPVKREWLEYSNSGSVLWEDQKCNWTCPKPLVKPKNATGYLPKATFKPKMQLETCPKLNFWGWRRSFHSEKVQTVARCRNKVISGTWNRVFLVWQDQKCNWIPAQSHF